MDLLKVRLRHWDFGLVILMVKQMDLLKVRLKHWDSGLVILKD